MTLTDEQLERYSRQMLLSGIGGVGQEKLSLSKVLVVGAGGLGSSCLLHLAAAGVGTIGIIDFDKVELSNLHRQIIHTTEDIGKPKVTSAKEKINKINPDIKVITYAERLEEKNVENILNDYEIIVDGLDNFKDKFLLNDICVKLNKKLVHAGVIGFEGQIMTIIPGSCNLRTLFPSGIPDELNRSCKDVGVLGTCVGIISTLQANEVLKLALNIGEPLINKILKFMSRKY
jgi:adenylyltransferase/sulfurtransferase